MKLFYTGPAINAEMLLVMLEKHGITGAQQAVPGESNDEDDLNRQVQVLVPDEDHERAQRLFYTEREDEL